MPKFLRVLPLVVVTLFVLTYIPKAYSYQSCNETKGTVTRNSYRSTLAETNMVYSIYTPPCYDQTSRLYPVVYLMHGSNEDDGQWIRLGLPDILNQGIADGTLPPMIVVLPFGNWLANENQFDTASWEKVFLQELMPLVEGQYRIDARRETREIGGISRGGFWAFEIAFRHPELFSAVGGHSAFFDTGNAPPKYNPLNLATSSPEIANLRISLDRGGQDYAAPGLDLMDKRLNESSITHDYTIYPEGQHANSYWIQHVAEYMQFYAADWLSDTLTPAPFTFATNTPAATTSPSATPAAQSGYELFLPAVAFPSLQTTMTSEALQAIRSGTPDTKIVLSKSTAARLAQLGISIASDTRTVDDEALSDVLWRDRSLYTLLPFDQLTPRYRVLHIDDEYPLDTDLHDYPFAFQSAQPNFDPSKLTRLLMSGVTALTRLTREALDEHGVEWAGEAIKPYVDKADFFHTSNEVSFSPDCPHSETPTLGEFCSKEDHFNLLTDIGLDIVELTGNHNNDYGTDNYLKTLDWYHEHKIQTIGGGEDLEQAEQPLLINHHGNKIAMVACNWAGPYYALASDDSPGAAYCDWNWLRATLPKLKAENDLLVVTVQYKEYEDYKPTQQQESDFRGLADLGADVVIGTQAHKPQTFEFYNARTGNESFIHYGMGNLFFDQPFWGNSRFFMDELFVYNGKLLTVDLFTGIIDDLARPRPMTADEQLNFLAFMFNTEGGS